MLVKGRRSLRECSNVRLWVGRYTEAALALLVVEKGSRRRLGRDGTVGSGEVR